MTLLVEITGLLLEKIGVAMKKPAYSEMTCIKVVKNPSLNHFIVQIFPMTKKEIFMTEILVYHQVIQLIAVGTLPSRMLNQDLEEENFNIGAMIA